MGYIEYTANWADESSKCNKEIKVLSCKATNRANWPKTRRYGDNEEVSGVTYIELFGLTGRRLKWAIYASIPALK